MKQTSGPAKKPAEAVIKDIRRATPHPTESDCESGTLAHCVSIRGLGHRKSSRTDSEPRR
jgi:hypothetical protein